MDAGISAELEVICAFDVGSTALKGAAISRDGVLHACVEVPIATHSAPGGVSEQDADEWWAAFGSAARELCAQLRARGLQPVAVALCGQMQDTLLVDARARPIRSALLYSDSRAHAQAATIARRNGDGAPLGAQLAGYKGAVSLLPKLLWLHEHEPETLRRAAALLLGAHSLVAARLLGDDDDDDGDGDGGGGATARAGARHGSAAPASVPRASARPRFFVDSTTASTTGLTSVATGGWALEMLARLLPEVGVAALLPTLAAADEPVGAVSAGVARALRCEALGGLPLFHGCGDAGAVSVGVGAGVVGGLYASLGTSGWVAATLDGARRGAARPGLFELAHPTAVGGAPGGARLRLTAASCMACGANVEWARSLLGGAEALAAAAARDATAPGTRDDGGEEATRASGATPRRLSYAALDALAARAPAGAGGVLWAPWLSGERSPFTDSAARGCLLGLSPSSGAAEVCRAVLEGVAYSTRALLELVLHAADDDRAAAADGGAAAERAAARAPAELLVCGGATRSAVWMQVLADVLGRRVVTADAAEHAGVRGAAILAGQPRGLGWFERLDPPGLSPRGRRYEPTADAATRRRLDRHYRVYSGLHDALAATFAGLSGGLAADGDGEEHS